MKKDKRSGKQDKRLAIVIGVLNTFDPEGLLKMGAPKDEYTSEAKSILEAIDAGKELDAELVRSIWAKWFGEGSGPDGKKVTWAMPMRPAFKKVAKRLRTELMIDSARYYVAMVGVGVGFVLRGSTLVRRVRQDPDYYTNAYGPFRSVSRANSYRTLLARVAGSKEFPGALMSELDCRDAKEKVVSINFDRQT